MNPLKTNLIQVLLLLCLFGAGCAIAPLTGGYSAKPLGKSNVEFTETTSFVKTDHEATILPLTNARILIGLTEAFDVGVQTDQITSTLLGKYSFENSESPFFHKALIGGISHISTTEGWFFGGIVSREFGAFEPFLMLRFFEVTLNPNDFDYKYITTVDYAIRHFFLGNVGFKYWLKSDFALGTDYTFVTDPRAYGFRPAYLTNIFVSFQF